MLIRRLERWNGLADVRSHASQNGGRRPRMPDRAEERAHSRQNFQPTEAAPGFSQTDHPESHRTFSA